MMLLFQLLLVPSAFVLAELQATGRLDTTTDLRDTQLLALATDGLDKRDNVEQQQLVQDVTNLVQQQLVQKVREAAEEDAQAKADLFSGALHGGSLDTQQNKAWLADWPHPKGWGWDWPPNEKRLAWLLDKDPDKYDDYLAMQHNKSTEIAGHKVHFPTDEGDDLGRLPLRYTSHKCSGLLFEHRVCHLYNVILWNGTFLYVGDDHTDNSTLPNVQMTYIAADPFRFKTNLTSVMNSTDPGQYTKEGLFDWGSTPKIVIEEAMVFYMSYHNNYGHLMGETAPLLHQLLCTYMGRCSYSPKDREGVQIFMYNKQPNVTTIMPKAIREELWPCFTDHPVLRMNDGSIRGKAILIKHLVAGVGPSCRGFPWCRARFLRVGPSPLMMAGWKERVQQCVGLPSGLEVNPKTPNVVIINRPLQHGRGFINAVDIAHRLEKEFKQLTVHVEELDQESLASQASKYYKTDILIQMHGAALGNVVFLPKGAIFIDVVPEHNSDKHTWAFFIGRDYLPLQVNPMALPEQKVELMESIISATPEWGNMTKAQQEMVLKDHKCPPQSELPFLETVCYVEWFMKRSNSYLDFEQLKALMKVALESLEAWQYKRDASYAATSLDITDFRPDRELADLV